MQFRILLSALALGSLGAVHLPVAAQEAGASANEPVQCRYQRVTGTRTKAYRICLTKSEWRKRAVEEQEELERLRGNTTHTLEVARTS